jgi:hypothetical protein
MFPCKGYPFIDGRLAQRLERSPHTREVKGSNPLSPTILSYSLICYERATKKRRPACVQKHIYVLRSGQDLIWFHSRVHLNSHNCRCSHKYGRISLMKTTLEIPDNVVRRAKLRAAGQGIPLRRFVTEAIKQKLREPGSSDPKPWMKHVGKLKDLHEETKRIDKFIEDAFETIDEDIHSNRNPS